MGYIKFMSLNIRVFTRGVQEPKYRSLFRQKLAFFSRNQSNF